MANLLSYFTGVYNPRANAAAELRFISRVRELQAKRRLKREVVVDAVRLALENHKHVPKPKREKADAEPEVRVKEEDELKVRGVKARMKLDQLRDVAWAKRQRQIKPKR